MNELVAFCIYFIIRMASFRGGGDVSNGKHTKRDALKSFLAAT